MPGVFALLGLISIVVSLHPDKFLLYFLNAKIKKSHESLWDIELPTGTNLLEADRCSYDLERERFIFWVQRRKIELGFSEQHYLILFFLIRKVVRHLPINWLRFIFLPIAITLYFYQMTAKVFLVPGHRSEDLPSLIFNRDLLTLLRV